MLSSSKVRQLCVVVTLLVAGLVLLSWGPLRLASHPMKTSNQVSLTLNTSRARLRYQPLRRGDVQSVKKFVFFTGYPRSGHSIIDAHPHVLLSYGYFLFRRLLGSSNAVIPNSRAALFEQIHKKSFQYSKRSPDKDGKGYTLDVPGSWSGVFEKPLRIIGDKSAKPTGDAFLSYEHPEEFKAVYKKLQSIVKVPLLGIHVVRNPYDMIATQALYRTSMNETRKQRKANFSEDNKLNNPGLLRKTTKMYFDLARAVVKMVPLCNMTILELHNEDLVLKPAQTMHRVCEYLGVECSEDYVRACVNKVFPQVSRTRGKVSWPPDLRTSIDNQMKTIPFFSRYSFDK